MRRQMLATVMVAVAVSRQATGQTPAEDARLIAATRRFIPEVMQVYGVRGIEIAIARHGAVIWQGGFGTAVLSDQRPMTSETVFAAGSMSKTYTATAVMQLVEQGVLALDEPINTYLRRNRAFEVANPLGAREITVRDLLTHRSGLTSDAAGSEIGVPAPLQTYLREQFAHKMLYSYDETALPLWSAPVGEKYQYSNQGIATLGLLVEITNPEHLSFENYVDRHIFQPLGMRSTQFPALQDSAHLRPDLARRFARGYAKLGPVDLPSPQLYLGDYPAGTLVTTAGDHIRLLLAYLNGGVYDGQRILRPESVKLMLTEGPTPGVGLVWRLSNIGSPDFNFGHGGAYMFGWRNEFRAYPGLDLAAVVATNQWDMLSPSYGPAYGEVLNFIASWVRHEQDGRRHPQPDTTWAWKCSYVIGLVWVDQIMGGLGTHAPLTPQMIDAAARGAQVRGAGAGRSQVWDEAGFRAGVDDLRHVAMQPDSIRAFLGSDRVRVWPEELNLIYAVLGGSRDYVPWPEFAPAH
jgi:CubicO group peptidase (beta-lactamase class C family)